MKFYEVAYLRKRTGVPNQRDDIHNDQSKSLLDLDQSRWVTTFLLTLGQALKNQAQAKRLKNRTDSFSQLATNVGHHSHPTARCL